MVESRFAVVVSNWAIRYSKLDAPGTSRHKFSSLQVPDPVETGVCCTGGGATHHQLGIRVALILRPLMRSLSCLVVASVYVDESMGLGSEPIFLIAD